MFKNISYTALTLVLLLFSISKVEAVWNLPAVPISSTNSSEPQIGIDTAGNAVAVWQEFNEPNSTVFGSTLPVCSSGWTTPVAISSPSMISNQNPQVAVDPNGNAVAVWVSPNGTNDVIQGATLPFGATNWIATTDLSQSPGNAATPQVVVDPNGNAIAVFTKINRFGNTVTEATTLAFGSPNWTLPNNLSVSNQNTVTPQVAVDPNGNAVAVWQNDTLQTVQAATLAFGSNMWAATTLNAVLTLGFPLVEVDAAGNAVTTWFNGNNTTIESSTLPFGTTFWTSPILVSAAIQNTGLAVDHAGNAVAVWSQVIGIDDVIQSATLPFGANAWSSISTISTSGGQAFDAKVQVDAAGNAFAIWDKGITLTDSIIQAAMLPFGGSWTAPTDLSDPNQVSDFPQIAVNPSGYAVALWTNETLTQIEATTWRVAPTVTNVNPNSGSTTGGNVVTITGTNFCSATSVTFGSNNAVSFNVISDTSIQATVPAGAPGTVDVTVTTGIGTSPITPSDHYTYVGSVVIPPKKPHKFHALLIKHQHHHHHHKKYFSMHTWWSRSKQPPKIAFYKIYKDGKVIEKISAKRKPRFITKIHSLHNLHNRYKIRAETKDKLKSSARKLKVMWIKSDNPQL